MLIRVLTCLNFSLHVLDGVRGLNLEGDGLAGEGLHEDLHAAPELHAEEEGGIFLDVVVGNSPAVLQLLPPKAQPLLVSRDTLLVLKTKYITLLVCSTVINIIFHR